MKAKCFCLVTLLIYVAKVVNAENFNSVVAQNNVRSTQGNIFTDVGFIRANSYFVTPGYLSVGTSGTFGSYVTVGGNLTTNASFYAASRAAVGNGSSAPGGHSMAIGWNATAQSHASLVIGRFNILEGNANGWVPTDPVFVVGNGTDANNRSNAFTIYKDGTIRMGKIQGDILAGQFGVPPTP